MLLPFLALELKDAEFLYPLLHFFSNWCKTEALVGLECPNKCQFFLQLQLWFPNRTWVHWKVFRLPTAMYRQWWWTWRIGWLCWSQWIGKYKMTTWSHWAARYDGIRIPWSWCRWWEVGFDRCCTYWHICHRFDSCMVLIVGCFLFLLQYRVLINEDLSSVSLVLTWNSHD